MTSPPTNADHFHIRRVPTPSTIAYSIPRYYIILAELMGADFRSRSYRALAHAGGLFVAAAAGADRPATKRSGWKLRPVRGRLCLATRNSCSILWTPERIRRAWTAARS